MSLVELSGGPRIGAIQRLKGLFSVDEGFSAFFSDSTLEENDWKPSIFDGLFRDYTKRRYASAVATACVKLSLKRATCCHFRYDEAYELNLVPTDLDAVSRNLFGPSYCIVEEKMRFGLVSDGDYYWAIAGSSELLEAVLAAMCSDRLETARTKYLKEVEQLARNFGASDWPERKHISKNLVAYLERCRSS